MKNQDPNIPMRQEEIREIIGAVPPWIIRWGSLMLFIVLFTLLAGTLWFKYPDRIRCQLLLTTQNPPVVLNARQNGRIVLLAVTDSCPVNNGQLLAVIESSAQFADFLELDSLINGCRDRITHPDSMGWVDNFLKDYKLGQWQPSLAAFTKAHRDLAAYLGQRSGEEQLASLKRQQKDYRLLFDRQSRQQVIKSEETKIQQNLYQRLVSLSDSGAVSAREFEEGTSVYLKARYDLEAAAGTMSETQISIDRLDHEIILLKNDYQVTRNQKFNLLLQAFDQLEGTVSDWKLNFTLIAPLDGIVSFTRVWAVNQLVGPGDRVMTIISGNPGSLKGKVLLPLAGAGKVRAGQKAIIRIDRYPYMEYGSLRGTVESISLVSDQDFYSVEVSLPQGLKTTYNKELAFSQGMSGQAEIITDEMSFLVRIFNPLRSILERNRLFKKRMAYFDFFHWK